MPKEQFRHEVEKYVNQEDCEPSDIIYFMLYKSQVPVVEQAIETAALMLGSDKSRGCCLEIICADFLAGAHACDRDSDVLLDALVGSQQLMDQEQRVRFMTQIERQDAEQLARFRDVTAIQASHSEAR
jgi:hypothetical protein